MANLPEVATWEPGIFQLELDTLARGGPDGEMNVQAKQLANRTQWLKEKVDQLVGTDVPDHEGRITGLEGGVRRVREVSNVGALASLEAQAGEVALVPRHGVYRYNPDSSLDELLPWVVESSHGGRWEHELVGLVREPVPHGVAKLDHEGRVPASSVRQGVVRLFSIVDRLANSSEPPPAAVELPTSAPEIVPMNERVLDGLAVGDVVDIDGWAVLNVFGQAGTQHGDVTYVWAVAVGGGALETVVGADGIDPIDGGVDALHSARLVRVRLRIEIQDEGDLELRLLAKCSQSGTMAHVANGQIVATVYRP